MMFPVKQINVRYPCVSDSEFRRDGFLFTVDCFGSSTQIVLGLKAFRGVSGLIVPIFLPNRVNERTCIWLQVRKTKINHGVHLSERLTRPLL